MQPGGPLVDDPHLFFEVVAALHARCLAADDIAWSESCSPPETPEAFALETIFVIANSGMHNKVARRIFDACRDALHAGSSATTVFGHEGKAKAMDQIWRDRAQLHAGFLAADDKIAFCRSIPWIGGITSHHLAKNFGADVAKPDTHLQKLADRHRATPQELCEIVARASGFRVATVDVVLWRACAERLIDPRTGTWRRDDPAPPRRVYQEEMFQPVQQDLFA